MQKILIVNNDLDTMSLLKAWLQKKNYDVIFTANKDEVISIIQAFHPQLILIDILHINMIKKIKAKPRNNSIRIMVMTGYTHRGNNTMAGVDDTIEKPFDLPLLEDKIKKLLPSVSDSVILDSF